MTDSSTHELSGDSGYSLEIVSTLTGVSSETILHYQEHGLIQAPQKFFDDETVRTLRRVEYLRETSGANLLGLKLMLDLMREVEHLRLALKSKR